MLLVSGDDFVVYGESVCDGRRAVFDIPNAKRFKIRGATPDPVTGLYDQYSQQQQASTTSWNAGNINGNLNWVTAISTAGTLANGSSVMANADVTNGTGLDIFADISFAGTIGSSTIAAGANLAFWIYPLGQDGTSYGDNKIGTTGTPNVPSFPPSVVVPLFAGASQTTIVGIARGIILPPGTFRWVIQNNSGFAFTAMTIAYRSYNTNLNR